MVWIEQREKVNAIATAAVATNTPIALERAPRSDSSTISDLSFLTLLSRPLLFSLGPFLLRPLFSSLFFLSSRPFHTPNRVLIFQDGQ